MTGLYGFVVMAWLVVSPVGFDKPIVPFASMEACEAAAAKLGDHSFYRCIPTGAKP